MVLAKEQIRRAFSAIVRRCLHHHIPVEQRCVIFPEPGDPLFSGRTRQEDQILVILLDGKHQTRHYRDGQLTHTTFGTGDIYFMDTDCPTKFEWKHPCQRFGIAVNPSRLSMSWNRYTPPGDVQIPDLLFQWHQPPPRSLSLLFDLMASRRDAPSGHEVTGQTARLILLAVAEVLASPQPNISDPTNHHRLICDYLDENLDQPLDRKTVSAFFHLHPDYISRLFAQAGMGFSDYLETQRIMRAGELLQSTALPVHRIAAMCGFSSSGYFIKVFRKHRKLSPGAYRQHKRREPSWQAARTKDTRRHNLSKTI